MSRIFTLHDEMLMVAQLKQQAILAEALRSPETQGVEVPLQTARRRFLRAYHLRSFLFRLAPRLAARLIL